MKYITFIFAIVIVCAVSSICPRMFALDMQKSSAENLVSYPAASLAKRFSEAHQTVSRDGTLLKIGRHEIRVESRIENEAQKQGRWVVGVGVRVILDGKDLPALRSGAVGIDVTRDKAIETAADEWSMEYGTVLIRALFPEPADTDQDVAGRFRILAGPIGIRGTVNPKNIDASIKEASDSVSRFVNQSFPGSTPTEFHGIDVAVALTPQQGVSPMCHVDGKESLGLDTAISRVHWPSGTTCIFKRFFLAVPAK